MEEFLSLLKVITNLLTMREVLFRYLSAIASIKWIKIKRIVANFKNYLHIVTITKYVGNFNKFWIN